MYYSSSSTIDDTTSELPPFNISDDKVSTAGLGSTRSEIRVVSFDLDNTIWKTGPTITDANDALANHLHEKFGIVERSEKFMGQIFKQFPNRYAGIDFSQVECPSEEVGDVVTTDSADIVQNVGQTRFIINPSAVVTRDDGVVGGINIQATIVNNLGKVKKSPVYLTALRKDAIRTMILEANSQQERLTSSPIDLDVDMAFEVWMEARCRSISNNFAPSAVTILQNLKSQLSSTNKSVYLCAITDGNSYPERVPELTSIFDFVIRAEDVGVSKPDGRMFKAAVAALMFKLGQDGKSIEEFFLGEKVENNIASSTYVKLDSDFTSLSWKDIEEDAVEAFADSVGPWWVHVGDDFFKDVVASKEFQMRTVWSRELIGGSKNSSANIGSSDFLAETLQDEFCDAILDQFSDLSGLLINWNEECKSK
jgi:FMN phosphatase YigB (HAD superfamily)